MKLNGMVETPFHKTIDPVEKVPSDCLPRVLFLYPVDTTFVRSISNFFVALLMSQRITFGVRETILAS